MLWRYLCYTIALIFGAGMILGGSFVLYSIPTLFSEKIKSNLPILRGTDAYNRYTQSSVPLYAKMYMFNVTNPNDVVQNGAKPILQQIGPFSFTERRYREIVSISSDNKTLDYKLYRIYFFNANESVPLDSIITLPNAGAFSAAYSAELKKKDEESAADPVSALRDYTQNETIYITHTANDWLFEGIKLEFLDKLNEDGVYFDDQPPNNKFGFYYKKNNTWDEKADGIMTISTGADGDFANIGRVVKWNGKSELSYWKGKSCNTLKGTDGQFFHPNVQKDEKLDIFAPDLCRTLTIEYIKTTSIRSIELYRFGIAASFFKPMNYNEETKCYCVKGSHEKKQFCKLSGLIDVSTCRKKPIILSTPHFYNGEQLLRDKFDGLSPSAANHDTFIDIEPMTGAVLRVRRRLQVNVEMFKSEAFEASNVLEEKLLHPYVWLDQSVTIPDDLAQKLENRLTKMARLLRILCYAALITGPIILIALLIFICRNIRSEDKKIRSAKISSSSSSKNKNSNKNKKDTGGDYQKIQVIMKPLNTSVGGDNGMDMINSNDMNNSKDNY